MVFRACESGAGRQINKGFEAEIRCLRSVGTLSAKRMARVGGINGLTQRAQDLQFPGQQRFHNVWPSVPNSAFHIFAGDSVMA